MMAFTVFGVDLDFLLRREAVDGEVPPGTIPSVLERLINEVEQRGLTEVGICASLLFFRDLWRLADAALRPHCRRTFRSQRPEGRPEQRWVCSLFLPALTLTDP